MFEQQGIQLYYLFYSLLFPFIGRTWFFLSIILCAFPASRDVLLAFWRILPSILHYLETHQAFLPLPIYFYTIVLIYYAAFFHLLSLLQVIKLETEEQNFLLKKVLKHILVFILVLYPWGFLQKRLGSIHFLSLPYGESIIIKTTDMVYMIDTGGHFEAEKNQYQVDAIIMSFLEKLKITKLDALVLTHMDADHSGSAIYLSTRIKIDIVYVNNKTPLEFRQQFSDSQVVTVETPVKQQELQIFPVLTSLFVDDNDASLLVYGIFGGKSWLFMGDAEAEAEHTFIKRYPDVTVDVIKVGHHGSKTSTTEALLQQLQPTQAIIVVQQKNIHHHPHQEVLERLKAHRIKTLITKDVGSIHYYFFSSFGFFVIY